MKLLVTGASGYIGSHVCKLLKEREHSVIGWDIEIHDEINDVSDYCDEYKNLDITSEQVNGAYDAIIHLAGRSVVPQSFKEPTEYYRVNIMGTDNLLSNVKTPHILFASTASAWGMNSPYARSKVAAEDIIKEKAKGYTIFRFFNVSGTDGINKQLGNATHLIRIAAMAATGKIPGVKIYGEDYDTRDGTCIRDYIHVEDIAKAHILTMENLKDKSKIYNLGTGKGNSVKEMIKIIKKISGKNFKVLIEKRRVGDPPILIADSSKIKRELGWVPEKDFGEELRKTLKYFMSNL